MLIKMLRRRFRGFLLVLALVQPVRAQDTAIEDRVKATYIYNFLQYVEWPATAFNDGAPLTVCIARPQFQSIMEETVRGETIGGRAIAVRTIAAGETGRGCQVIYVTEALNPGTADLLKAARTSPVLTIGEDSEFMQNGGIIRFVKGGNRIRFEINPAAAERASLTLSSRLLRLADIVRDPPRRAP